MVRTALARVQETPNVSEIGRAGFGEQPRKAEVVLRLLRGEDIGEVSREVRVAPPELERWRRVFLDGGQQGPEGEEPDGRAADAEPGRSWER